MVVAASEEGGPRSGPGTGSSPPATPETTGSARVAPTSNGSPSRVGRAQRRRRWGWLRSPSGLTLLVVAAFVVVGGYWRLIGLGSVSEWNDEAQSTIYALSILRHGTPGIVSQHLINNWEPLYPYLEAVSIAILGQSDFAFRLPSAILGISLIPISYWVGARLRDRYVGLTLAAMVAFSSEYIAWSRQARWYMLFVVLMALGTLAALAWARSPSRRGRVWGLAAVAGACIALAFTSVGLFLLYAPGIFAGLAAYVATVRWSSIRRFFQGPPATDPSSAATVPRWIPYRFRLPLVLVAGATVVLVALLEVAVLSKWTSVFLGWTFGFSTYPPVWSTLYGSYLLSFYSPIVALCFASVYFIARKRDPFEIGLLAFCVVGFAGVSVGSSLTNNVAGGLPPIERHIVPLIFFLFLLSAISAVELIRWVATAIDRSWPRPRRLSKFAPAVFGAAIVVMLVVPSVVVPSGQNLNTFKSETPADGWVAWVPFTVAPAHPWALYQTSQANYELASDYVLAHRSPGDVVGATTTGPPRVYLGDIEYWIRGNAIPSTIYYRDGRPTFYQTGAVLVANISQVENLLYNSSGWFISDIRGNGGPAFPGQMSLVFHFFMTPVANGSDPTIFLYHWNQSTPVGLVQELIREFPPLYNYTRGWSLQGQLGWAVTNGVRSFFYRSLLVPIAPYLLPLIRNETTRGLGTLFNLYNNRTDLQAAFPGVVSAPYNDTALLSWACSVASGIRSDYSYPVLAPYESVYCR